MTWNKLPIIEEIGKKEAYSAYTENLWSSATGHHDLLWWINIFPWIICALLSPKAMIAWNIQDISEGMLNNTKELIQCSDRAHEFTVIFSENLSIKKITCQNECVCRFRLK